MDAGSRGHSNYLGGHNYSVLIPEQSPGTCVYYWLNAHVAESTDIFTRLTPRFFSTICHGKF